jgi:hypothetical protein
MFRTTVRQDAVSNIDVLSGIGLSSIGPIYEMSIPGVLLMRNLILRSSGLGYILSSVLSRIDLFKGLVPSKICRSRVCPVSCLS